MEIHSSSLTFIPNGYQPKENKKQQADSVHQEPKSIPLTREISAPVDTKSFQQLSTIIESQRVAPTYSQNARALNAYVQESIKPLQTQRSEFISNIDIFA